MHNIFEVLISKLNFYSTHYFPETITIAFPKASLRKSCENNWVNVFWKPLPVKLRRVFKHESTWLRTTMPM